MRQAIASTALRSFKFYRMTASKHLSRIFSLSAILLFSNHASAQEKLTDADKEPMEKAVAKLREVSGSDDLDAIKSAVKDLEQAQQAWSKVLYEKAAAEQPAQAEADATGGSDVDDDAIDAEFEVKKD